MGWKAAQKLIQNWKIVRGDSVMIIRGKDRGETGLIKRVIRSQNRVIVEGKNLVKKHIKQGQGHEGGIFSVEAPLHVSNVQVVDPVTGKKSMAMKAAMMAAMSATKPRVLNRLFTTSAFNFSPPQQSSQQPAAPLADPSPNLFVSGLSKRTTTEGLHEAFSKFGEVVHAKVVTDRGSGFSKGFGFVKYSTTEEAAAGIEGMNGAFLDGWVIFAEFAKPRPPSAYQQQNGSSSFGRGRF